jgi:hypothetical protein
MLQSRDNPAESLGQVLELLRIRRQNGLLSVERLQGDHFEEGEIYFQAGQPVHARTGQLAGQQALSRLLSWRQVYFTFLADQPRPPISSAENTKDSMALAANGSTSPRSNTYVPPASLPSPNFLRLPQVNPDAMPEGRGERDAGYAQDTLDDNTSTPGLEWVIPKRLGGERDVLSLPLTRPQRSIYMLVNGSRTISDLARCTRKSVQEIERLLIELRERGLISI